MVEKKTRKPRAKKVVDDKIVINTIPEDKKSPVAPVVPEAPRLIQNAQVRDRLKIVSDVDINFFGKIKMTAGVPQVIAVDIFNSLQDKIPVFAQLVQAGRIRIV
jgi:hypothetical protein